MTERIERAAGRDDAPWDAFLMTRPGATFELSSKYRRLLRHLVGDSPTANLSTRPDWSMLVRDEPSGDIRGVLPIMRATGPYGAIWNSLPFYGSYGGVIADTPTAAATLTGFYNAQAWRGGAASTLVEHPLIDQPHDQVARTFAVERIGHFTDLSADLISARCSRRVRRSIGRAQAAGITAGADPEAIDWLADAQRARLLQLGAVAKSDEFFGLVRDELVAGADWNVYAARLDGAVVAAGLMFYFNGIVSYFATAVDDDFKTLQPTSLMLAAAMTDAFEGGQRVWDWGSSQSHQTAIRQFKNQWATVERPFNYLVHVADESLLERPRAELLDAYPNYFVVPFEQLAGEHEVIPLRSAAG